MAYSLEGFRIVQDSKNKNRRHLVLEYHEKHLMNTLCTVQLSPGRIELIAHYALGFEDDKKKDLILAYIELTDGKPEIEEGKYIGNQKWVAYRMYLSAKEYFYLIQNISYE